MCKKILILSFLLLLGACSSYSDGRCSGSTLKHCEPIVYFDSNSTALGAQGEKRLDWAVAKLKRWPERKVILTGYADLWGDLEINKRISLKRAEAVKRYLVKKGISADRIQTVGRGKQKPVSTLREKQNLNRRVEVKFGHKDRLFFLNPDRLCEDCCSDL